jgi:membrane fusion protein (multidrug efflux system)
VELAQSDEVISIPNSSISYAPYGNSVYVVDKPSAEEAEKVAEDSEAKALPTARAQVVNLGRRRGDLIAVISGLKEGDEIVSSGAFKVRPGVSLIVNNSVVPGANPNPTPADT